MLYDLIFDIGYDNLTFQEMKRIKSEIHMALNRNITQKLLLKGDDI